jgi:chromosome segregation ATPase
MAAKERELTKAVSDLSKQAKKIDVSRLKGRIRVVTKDDIRRMIASVIDSNKGLAHKDLLTKIGVYELKIQSLENSQAELRKQLESTSDADKELAVLKQELNSLQAGIVTKDAEIEDMHKKLEKAQELIAAVKVERAETEKRLQELEALSSDDDLIAQIAGLKRLMTEMEHAYQDKIRVLKARIHEIEIALEFNDFIENIALEHFRKPIEIANGFISRIDSAIASRDDDTKKALAEAFYSIRIRLENILDNFSRYDPLIEEMEKGNGTIAVVNEVENINSKNLWALDDLHRTNNLLEAICSLLGA